MASVMVAAYDIYERRICATCQLDQIPGHIGVMCDGNRRWARSFGEEVEGGYVAGADKIEEFLGWCDQLQRQARHAVAAVHRQPRTARPTRSSRCSR